ncbi:MAG: pyrroline-5-carboxylate reductase [Solirubrobacterales bacterium]
MKIGFIGSGNMAAAMARGWASAEDFDGSMLFTDGGSGRAAELAAQVKGEAVPDNGTLAATADLLVLAIKPAQLGTVAVGLTRPGKPVLSLLAATSLDTLEAALPGIPVLRVMPNLPVEVRRGVLCYACAEGVAGEIETQIRDLLSMLGEVILLDDDLIDAATAVMGCSPAYVAQLAETLTGAAVERGIDHQHARRMVNETIAGTAELLDSREALALRRDVASPGGSTEKGLEALQRGGFTDALRSAVDASLEKMGR